MSQQTTTTATNSDALLALLAEKERNRMRVINLFHALLVAPFLVYVGFKGYKSPPFVFYVLLYIGFIAHFYHMYRFFYPRSLVLPAVSGFENEKKEEIDAVVKKECKAGMMPGGVGCA